MARCDKPVRRTVHKTAAVFINVLTLIPYYYCNPYVGTVLKGRVQIESRSTVIYRSYGVLRRKVHYGNECSTLKFCDMVNVSLTTQVMNIGLVIPVVNYMYFSILSIVHESGWFSQYLI